MGLSILLPNFGGGASSSRPSDSEAIGWVGRDNHSGVGRAFSVLGGCAGKQTGRAE